MELKSIKCPNCGSPEITDKNICRHCGSQFLKEERKPSKPLNLSISGMANVITIRKGKNSISSLDISGMSETEEVTCESLNLDISGMANVIKIDKDVQILKKDNSGMANKIIII